MKCRTSSLGLIILSVLSVSAQAATFTVTNRNNSGPGSLRSAIHRSNQTGLLPAIHNRIVFRILGHAGQGGLQTIQLASPLPRITRPVTIDGTTQRLFPGHSCHPVLGHPCIEVRGGGLTESKDSVLTIVAGNSTIKGLVINGPSYVLGGGALITLTKGGGNLITGNYLGTNVTGTAAYPTPGGNGYVDGIRVRSKGNRIGGPDAADRNLISGNAVGVAISGARRTNNTVQGNYIGTDRAGTAPLPNIFVGIRINASSNTIGGTVPGARNLISGNAVGIAIESEGNVVTGNYIGTDVTGTLPLGNAHAGIHVYSPNNRIGGPSAAERNIISANGSAADRFGAGIYVYSAAGIVIQGNYVGTDVNGTGALPNAPNGIFIFDTLGAVMIGGTAPEAGNLISGNSGVGIRFEDKVTGSVVQGNLIGTQLDGSSPLGNGSHGVFLDYFASEVTVGGMPAGVGNTIAYNGGAGVAISIPPSFQTPARHVAILGNAIRANGGLEIDLGDDGATPNDADDADVGPNDLQNFPVLTSASSNGTTTAIQGMLNSVPNCTTNCAFRVEFFANAACDPARSEGQKFLWASTATTDAAGNASFDVTLPVGVAVGQQISATATDANGSGSTSEFSGCQPVAAGP